MNHYQWTDISTLRLANLVNLYQFIAYTHFWRMVNQFIGGNSFFLAYIKFSSIRHKLGTFLGQHTILWEEFIMTLFKSSPTSWAVSLLCLITKSLMEILYANPPWILILIKYLICLYCEVAIFEIRGLPILPSILWSNEFAQDFHAHDFKAFIFVNVLVIMQYAQCVY